MSDVAEKDPCLRESIYRVNFIDAGGGDPLCTCSTLHRAEGLYGWVTRKGYMKDIPYLVYKS